MVSKLGTSLGKGEKEDDEDCDDGGAVAAAASRLGLVKLGPAPGPGLAPGPGPGLCRGVSSALRAPARKPGDDDGDGV